MTVRTTHVRAMLADAIRLAEEAEEMDAEHGAALSDLVRVRLDGAAVQARHAAAELADELHRHRHPGVLGT